MDVLTLIQILVSSTKLLHHASTLVIRFGLLDHLRVFLLAYLLQCQVGLLLPFLVYVLVLVILLNYLASLIPPFSHDLALSVNLLQRIAFLELVPLHDCLSLSILYYFVIIKHRHGYIIQISFLVVVPQI